MTNDNQADKQTDNYYSLLGLENNVSSPLILLIHGAGGDSRHYDQVTPTLIASGFRVLLLDIRYHGRSQLKSNGKITFRFSDVLKDIEKVLKKVKQEHYHGHHSNISLFVAGLSMGGMISLLFAADQPKKPHGFELKGLILIASSVPGLELSRPAWDMFRNRSATPEILEFTKASIIDSALTTNGKQETARAMGLISNDALYECLVAIAVALPPLSDPPHPYVPVSQVPALLLFPDRDIYTEPELRALHQANLDHDIVSRFETVVDSGHMAILDQPQQVADFIVSFYNSI